MVGIYKSVFLISVFLVLSLFFYSLFYVHVHIHTPFILPRVLSFLYRQHTTTYTRYRAMTLSKTLNIAFAGLGAMGFGMASHLVKEGHNVTGYDVYEPSLEKFRAVGGLVSLSPKEAARGNEYFICMVTNSQQAESVLFDSVNGAVQGMSMHSSKGDYGCSRDLNYNTI